MHEIYEVYRVGTRVIWGLGSLLAWDGRIHRAFSFASKFDAMSAREPKMEAGC